MAILTGESPFKEDLKILLNDAGVTSASEQVLGPFTEITQAVGEAILDGFLPASTTNSLHWPFLLLTVALAIVLFVVRKGRGAKGADGTERPAGFWQYLLPRDIYMHQSSFVDVGLYVLDRAMLPIWFVAFLGTIAPAVEAFTIDFLYAIFGPPPALKATTGTMLLYGLVSFLVADMIFFFTHLMMHKTRIGWAIHKVHHSAQVLTPLTRYREHFIAAPIWATGYAVGLSFVAAVFAYLYVDSMVHITLLNMSVFSFLYALNGNFRHHHISFRYPRWLEYWLQSPGMHHTHHSHLEKHWDTNLGLATSVWDRMFGTLYIAERYEATPWGLTEDEQADYTTLSGNLKSPFVEIAGILVAPFKRKRQARAKTEPAE